MRKHMWEKGKELPGGHQKPLGSGRDAPCKDRIGKELKNRVKEIKKLLKSDVNWPCNCFRRNG